MSDSDIFFTIDFVKALNNEIILELSNLMQKCKSKKDIKIIIEEYQQLNYDLRDLESSFIISKF